jgi:hypothetical protein
MTFRVGNYKVRITVKKDGGIVIEIEPWERKGGLTPPALKSSKSLHLHEIGH